jgi:hypothetical protein
MSSFLAFTIGVGAAAASLGQISLALDKYATAANPRRYTDKGMDMAKGPSSLNLSVRTTTTVLHVFVWAVWVWVGGVRVHHRFRFLLLY